MKHNQKFSELQDKLVPLHGKAETVEGEVIRAVGKLEYNYLNNRLCNNVTGPINFLIEIAKNKYPAFYHLIKELNLIKEYSTGEYCPACSVSKIEEALTKLIDQCVAVFYNIEAADKNTEDMWDYQEPNEYDDYDDYEFYSLDFYKRLPNRLIMTNNVL